MVSAVKWGVALSCAAALGFVSNAAEANPRTHDGFFFQGSVGFGPGWLNEELESGPTQLEISASGLTATLDLLFGGTPAPGLVLGGGLTAHSIVDPTLEMGDEEFETEDTSIGLTHVSLFTHFYPSPTNGLYLHGSIGYGGATVEVDDVTRDAGTNGIVLGAGVGYDFWIADEWSLGPQFRFTYAHLTGDEDGVEVTDDFLLPTLAFSATFH